MHFCSEGELSVMQAIEKKLPGTFVAEDRTSKITLDAGGNAEEWGTENKYLDSSIYGCVAVHADPRN